MTDAKAFCWVEGTIVDEFGFAFYDARYTLSPTSANHHSEGQVLIPFDGYTETEVGAIVQQAVADKITAETAGEYQMTINDVRGGRI